MSRQAGFLVSRRAACVSALVLLLTWCAPAAAADERAADVARIHLEAMGGRARVDALRAIRASGTVSMGGKRVRFTLVAARPDRIRLETESGGRTLVQASDGKSPPWEFDTGTWPPRYRDMAESAARTFVADAEFDDPLVAGAARGYGLEYVDETETDGRKLIQLAVTRPPAEMFSVFLDAETYLIRLRVEKRLSGGRAVQIVTRYEEFRPVAGVLLPHEVTTIVDGRVTQQTKIEQIVPNPELTEETFTRPPPRSN